MATLIAYLLRMLRNRSCVWSCVCSMKQLVVFRLDKMFAGYTNPLSPHPYQAFSQFLFTVRLYLLALLGEERNRQYQLLSNQVSPFLSLGMNTKDYKYKWGGEDWDLLDRVLMLPVEVERIKYPGLYHHYHAKTREWN